MVPVKGEVKFRDFNFKLFVINELMYNQRVLKPAFDIYDFADDYKGREIDVEGEGYDIIPEAKKHFESLSLTSNDLSKIKKLTIEASADIVFQVIPFWDGEDDSFDVKSIDDVKLLPNLKEIDFAEFETAKKKFQKKLGEMGVKVK